MEEQINIDDFETNHIDEQKNKQTINIGPISLRKRIVKFFGDIIGTLLINFSTKLRWQFGLVIYLAIVCPIGTYDAIKFIIHLFTK